MAVEAVIQVALDGAGKKTKTLVLTGIQQPDGTSATVYIPDVVQVDIDGRRIDFDNNDQVLIEIRRELSRIRKAFGELLDNAELTFDIDSDDNEDDGDEA
jgi:hypothetical protein